MYHTWKGFSVDYGNVNICYQKYFHPMDYYVHVSVGLNRKQKKTEMVLKNGCY